MNCQTFSQSPRKQGKTQKATTKALCFQTGRCPTPRKRGTQNKKKDREEGSNGVLHE